MNSKIFAIVIGVVLLAFLLIFSMTYSVRFNEVAIVTTFGEATQESVQNEPGLHFKLPAPIQSVRTYDSRLQTVDTRLETHATKDGLQVIAQAFVFWKIDPGHVLDFDQAYGSVDAASDDIEARMRSAVGALSEFEFDQLIGTNNDLTVVEQRIQERLTAAGANSRTLAELGVMVEKVGLSQVVLPVETTKKVVERQKKEMDETAEAVRSAGDAAAQSILSDAQRKAQTILDHADRLAAQIRAEGDALTASSIDLMREDPQFAQFLIWLDALEKSTAGAATFFVPTNFAPFHLLNLDNLQQSGVPMPPSTLPDVADNGRANEARRLADSDSRNDSE